MKGWSRNPNLQKTWSCAVYPQFSALLSLLWLPVSMLWVPLGFLNFGNKRTIHQLSGELSGSKFLIPTPVSQRFSGIPALTASEKLLGEGRRLCGGTDQTLWTAAVAKPQERVCARTHMCMFAWGLETNLSRDQYGLWIQPFRHATPLFSWLWVTDDNWIHYPRVGST